MTNDYKHTLNLPHTDFPMKANLPQREPQQLDYWNSIDVYQTVRKARRNCPLFFLHDGPPYANGQIHLGHAVNKVLKDLVTKSHLLDGFDSPYVPGWDCHGLPIEVNVEKKHGKAGVKVSHSEFRALCRSYAHKQVEQQKKDFKRLGILGDWDNPYMTMDYQIEADTIRALGKVIDNGYLRRGDKPVHWCFQCQSALAEAEVEYAEKTSDAIDVLFLFEDQRKVKELLDVSANFDIGLAIWTTTPWTIPANRGIALHPDYHYSLVRTRINDKPIGIIVAEGRVDECRQNWGKENDWEIVTTDISGRAFEKMKVRHPLYERDSLCVLADFVTLESGTGIVHSAPAYGQDDFVVGQLYQLPVDNPVQDNGVFNDDLALFGGMHINKANPQVIEQLRQHNALIHHEPWVHSYPHCWRHKTPTIQRATPQWFISMEQNNLSNKVTDAIKQINWVPSWGQERMQGMIETRPDWCISRQRSWGTPITLLLHKRTGDLHPRTSELIELIAQRVAEQGIEAWFQLKVEDLLPADEVDDYRKTNDTVDVWFDSGTTHYTVLGSRPELTYPADVYLEGSDQHRGWFQSSLISAVAMNGTAPYKTVLTHGFTVDKQGRKMSKSIGNIISPQEIINQFGADVLRLWIASTDYSGEMTLSQDILKQSADTYRRIRNTIRFLVANTSDFCLADDSVDSNELVALDAWVIENCRTTQQQIIADYQQFNYAKVVQTIYNFCASSLGSFYLDIIKDRLYTAKNDGKARRSAQTALWHTLEALCRWISPILSFTAEEIWQILPERNQQTIFSSQWYQLPKAIPSAITAEEWQQLQQIKDKVNKKIEEYRITNKSGSSLDLKVTIYADSTLQKLLKKIEPELHFLLICSEIELQTLSDSDQQFAFELAESTNSKCTRCWQKRPEVSTIEEHPQLCQRCVDNLGAGEERTFI